MILPTKYNFKNMQIDSEFSTWRNKNVPTFVVSPKDGNRKSLRDILLSLPPYSRVKLMSGLYSEQIIITNPVELVAREGECPEISSRPPCVTISCDCFMEGIGVTSRSITSNRKSLSAPESLRYCGAT